MLLSLSSSAFARRQHLHLDLHRHSSLFQRAAVVRVRTFSDASGVVVDQEVYAREEVPETGEWAGCKRSFMAPLLIPTRGSETLYNPLFNKGTAFKKGERDRLRFRGLLPARIMNIQMQKERFLQTLRAETSKIKQNILLEDLHDRNETLYHRVLVDHVSRSDRSHLSVLLFGSNSHSHSNSC